MADVIDLAAPGRWPGSFRDVIADLAAEVRTWPELRDDYPACDLREHDVGFAEEAEARARAAASGHVIEAFHATRLLPHEESAVRREGLVVLSDDLRDRKLADAAAAHPDCLDDDGQQLLRRCGPLTWQRGGVRRGLLWVVVPFTVVEDEADGLLPFLDRWGGEVISWTHDPADDGKAAAAVVDVLTAVSRPTLVAVHVDVDQIPEHQNLWWIAVGQVLGLPSAGAEWALTTPVPGRNVIDLVHPGHSRWPSVLAPRSRRGA